MAAACILKDERKWQMTWLDHVEINIQGKNDGQKEACGLQVAKNLVIKIIYGKFYLKGFDIVDGLWGFDDDVANIGYYKVALKLKINLNFYLKAEVA